MKNSINIRKFSYIHNFHSPHSLYIHKKEYIYDNTIDDYTNMIIKGFLNKRWTLKREIRKFKY